MTVEFISGCKAAAEAAKTPADTTSKPAKGKGEDEQYVYKAPRDSSVFRSQGSVDEEGTDTLPPRRAAVDSLNADSLDNKLPNGEYRVRLHDGTYRWIRHRNKCMRDADGKPIRLSGSVSDIDGVSSFCRSSVQVSLVPGRPASLRCQKVTLLLLFSVGSTKGRLAAVVRRLLESVRQPDEPPFVPGAPEEGHAGRGGDDLNHYERGKRYAD